MWLDRGRRMPAGTPALLCACGGFAAPDYFAVYYCRYWGALEFSVVEWGVLGFAGGIFGVECPLLIRGEDC